MIEQLNDTKLAALNFQNGETSDQIDDAENTWLVNQLAGVDGGSTEDLWMLFWDDRFISPGQFNDRATEWLNGLGFFGSMNNLWMQFWESLLP